MFWIAEKFLRELAHDVVPEGEIVSHVGGVRAVDAVEVVPLVDEGLGNSASG